MKQRDLALLGLIAFAVWSRLIPHPWNFTAVGAAALLAGAKFDRPWMAVLAPLAALWVSDHILGFHDQMFWVYMPYAVIALSAFFAREHLKGTGVAFGALSAALVFFVLSNFGVWLHSGMYPLNVGGLISCFVAAIPFAGGQFAGDLFCSFVLFATWAAVEKKWTVLQSFSRSR